MGTSSEVGLPSSWSRDGENLIWRQEFIGRSTPVVHNGRVFVTGRAGEGPTRHELLAAFDADTGEPLWQHVLTAQLTTVPYNRAGWAGPVIDRETGYVYAQGMAGPLVCYDRDGNLIWSRLTSEELGRFSGYGGRTHTPLIDEDRLIVSLINGSWGSLGAPRHRYYAFDKRTGDVIWTSTPGGNVYDRNTTANGVIAVIGGQRLYINGNADGHLYALQARTGNKVWEFELSKRGLNSSPIVVGNTVYAGHSEENIDEGTLGRTVAIDATGSGDVTATHELWRRDIKMGFPSPLYHDGRLYAMDNSANLFALNAESGETIWEKNVGTVGKSAPVWADGKIYVTEVNGNVWILKDAGSEAEELDGEYIEIEEKNGRSRYAEVYGSPAVAYGRVYFATEEGLYAIGDKSRAFELSESAGPALGAETAGDDVATTMFVVPGDVTVGHGDSVEFEIRTFNAAGRELGRSSNAEWSLRDLAGEVSSAGALTTSGSGPAQAGHVVAKANGLEATARVRSFPGLPWQENFDSVEGRGRAWWLGSGRYQVIDREGGGKMVEKPVAPRGLLRSSLLLGPPSLSDYTVRAEAMGGLKGRRKTDVGLINSGYFFRLLGNGQKASIESWQAVKRMAVEAPFEWEMGVWYTLLLRVDVEDGVAHCARQGLEDR